MQFGLTNKEVNVQDIKIKSGIIRIQKSEFKEKTYLDIRKFYQDKETDEWRPTRKGISIPLDLVEKVITAIKEVIK